LDRASDFESHFSLLQFITISHKNFVTVYLAGFRELPHK
jgi:hypothetical protein